MLRTRVIPVLLMTGKRLVKTVKFKNRVYVGDPINTVKIFNDKEVDELAIVDIDASLKGQEPDYDYIEKLASQCFMPLAFGGGIQTPQQARRLLALGVEKVILNTAAASNPKLISELAEETGSQSVVVSIDVKKNWLGKYEVRSAGGTRSTDLEPVAYAAEAVRHGAGEILINSIDRDGTQSGYDLDLIKKVTAAINVPVIACGGAHSIADFTAAIQGGASAVAAGSMFVFTGPHRAVLINFPKRSDLERALS
jgi:cyclase